MAGSRRQFFTRLAAAPAAWLAFSQKLSGAGLPEASNESYWRLVERQFPVDEGLIFLHAANVCPASRLVMDRHLELLHDFHGNPSFQNRLKYVAIQERLRGKLARLLGADADEIAIIRNTSEASNMVVQGIPLEAGDEVVITTHNHPSNNDSWKVRGKREGFVVKEVAVPVPGRSVQELFDGFEKAITPRTKVLAVTHVTNTHGLRYPVEQLGKLARQRNLWLHVDGAQTCGALNLNLHRIGCDSYSASAHKWPMGPLECGVLYVRGERIDGMWPSVVTAGWSNELKGARKFEVLGQRDDPRIAGFEAAVDFLNTLGMPAVEARMLYLADYLKKGLSRTGAVEFRTSLEPELSGGVVKFSIKGGRSKAVYDQLYEKYHVAGALTPSGDVEGIRLCPHVYNTTAQLDEVAAAVRKLAA